MEKTCDIKTSIIAMQTVISMILIAWGQNMILFVAFRVKATFALECRGVGSLALPAILWHLQLHAKRQGCRNDGCTLLYSKAFACFCFAFIANSINF